MTIHRAWRRLWPEGNQFCVHPHGIFRGLPAGCESIGASRAARARERCNGKLSSQTRELAIELA
jgi:hypothetical protein